MTDTPRLTLPEIASGQSNKSVTHNDALQILDYLCQSSVIDKDLTTPPGSPTNGDLYIVGPSGASGTWAGHEKDLAYYRSGWVFYNAFEGLTAWVKDEDVHYVFDGTNWVNAAAAGLDLGDLADVTLTDIAPGDMIRWNGYEWTNEAPPVWIGTDRTSGTPSASQVLMDRVIPAAIVLPASMLGSVAEANVAATAQTDFDVQKNGSSVGTIRFAASGTSASFIAASSASFVAADNLRIVAPASPDATLASIVITLSLSRS
jgi:hypothetical protein